MSLLALSTLTLSAQLLGSAPAQTAAVGPVSALDPSSAARLQAGPDWTAEGGQVAARLGAAVAAAGDVNGDGYSDVLVGAEGFDGGQTDEGKAYLFLGSATGLAARSNTLACSARARDATKRRAWPSSTACIPCKTGCRRSIAASQAT